MQSPTCGFCKKPINNKEFYQFFADRHWHEKCFSCTLCTGVLDPNGNVFLAETGPICFNCVCKCKVCGQAITEEAVMTGDDSYHVGCFRCIECSKEIGDLVFAQSEKGIQCSGCFSKDAVAAKGERRKSTVKAVISETVDSNNDMQPSQQPSDIQKELLDTKNQLLHAQATMASLREASVKAVHEFQSNCLALYKETEMRKIAESEFENFKLEQFQLQQLADGKIKQLEKEIKVWREECHQLETKHSQTALLEKVETAERYTEKEEIAQEAQETIEMLQEQMHQMVKEKSKLIDKLQQLEKENGDMRKKINAETPNESQQDQVNYASMPNLTISRASKRNKTFSDVFGTSGSDNIKRKQILTKEEKSQDGSIRESSITQKMRSSTINFVKNATIKLKGKHVDIAKLESAYADETSVDEKSVREKTAEEKKEAKGAEIVDVKHTFQSSNQLKSHTCDFCGDKIYPLNRTPCKCQTCGYICHHKCAKLVPDNCTCDKAWKQSADMLTASGLLGNDLKRQCDIEKRTVPFIVERCIAAVNRRGLEAEGIYRKSGASNQINVLIEAFNQGKIPELDSDEGKFNDIMIVTSALKQYLRQLPNPLITFEVAPVLTAAIEIQNEDERREAVKAALAQLPSCHYDTLAYLIAHLHRVQSCQSSNFMTIANLSVVFGPTVMRGRDALSDIFGMAKQAKAVEYLITNVSILSLPSLTKRSSQSNLLQ